MREDAQRIIFNYIYQYTSSCYFIQLRAASRPTKLQEKRILISSPSLLKNSGSSPEIAKLAIVILMNTR